MQTQEVTAPRRLDITKYLQRSDTHRSFDQQFRRGGAFGIEAVRLSTVAFEEATPAVDDFTIGMGLGKNVPSSWNYGDGWVGEITSQPGSALITPAGVSVEHRVRKPNEILLIACSNGSLSRLLGEHDIQSTDVFEPLVRGSFIQDVALRAYIQNLWKEAERESPASGLLIDALWLSIVARLLLIAQEPLKTKSYGLTHRQIAQVNAYIDENLGSAINTNDLAELTKLPLGQFSRDFKEATGCSPYQHVLSKRLERAQQELARGEKSLSIIALECGFSSQSHMTDVFRDKVGCTPGRFQRDILG